MERHTHSTINFHVVGMIGAVAPSCSGRLLLSGSSEISNCSHLTSSWETWNTPVRNKNASVCRDFEPILYGVCMLAHCSIYPETSKIINISATGDGIHYYYYYQRLRVKHLNQHLKYSCMGVKTIFCQGCLTAIHAMLVCGQNKIIY